uniref:Uncharacterized protein n=1 Tax=Mycena chlorophos TaxID=658473 RepID=A0ABQ0M893_MYCCL|nr:predicted protein [Mycena chlorophos]
MAGRSSSWIVALPPSCIWNALTRCKTRLSRFRGMGLGPFVDADRSSDVGAGVGPDLGKTIEVERARDDAVDDVLGGVRSTILCRAMLRGVASVGGDAGIVAGAEGRMMDAGRPPTGRGEGGKLLRITDPDRSRDIGRGDEDGAATASATTPSAIMGSTTMGLGVPLGVKTSPSGKTCMCKSRWLFICFCGWVLGVTTAVPSGNTAR